MKDLPQLEFPHDKLSECHSFYYFFPVLYYVAIPVFNVCFKYFLFSCWAQLSWGECPPLTSSLKLGPLCCVPYVCMIILPYPFFPYATWSHFFYYGESQNGKIYPFTNLKAIWSGKRFYIFYQPMSIKTALPTDKYRSVCKLKFPNLVSNEFADLQMYHKVASRSMSQLHSGCLDSKKFLFTIDAPPGHCVFKWILRGHLKLTPSATI